MRGEALGRNGAPVCFARPGVSELLASLADVGADGPGRFVEGGLRVSGAE